MAAANLDEADTLRTAEPQGEMVGEMAGQMAGPTTARVHDQAAGSGRPESTGAEEIRRIMREAAWARMFGKSGSANPFARS